MKYEEIKDFTQRCEEHPAHQTGMVTNAMIAQRLSEEIDELRAYIEQRTWVGLTDREKSNLWLESRAAIPRFHTYASLVEAKLKEKNT
jgi:hypothetical protein